jgi:hypothetical protein
MYEDLREAHLAMAERFQDPMTSGNFSEMPVQYQEEVRHHWVVVWRRLADQIAEHDRQVEQEAIQRREEEVRRRQEGLEALYAVGPQVAAAVARCGEASDDDTTLASVDDLTNFLAPTCDFLSNFSQLTGDERAILDTIWSLEKLESMFNTLSAVVLPGHAFLSLKGKIGQFANLWLNGPPAAQSFKGFRPAQVFNNWQPNTTTAAVNVSVVNVNAPATSQQSPQTVGGSPKDTFLKLLQSDISQLTTELNNVRRAIQNKEGVENYASSIELLLGRLDTAE